MEENTNIIEETTNAEPSAEITPEKKKEFDADALVASIFNKKPESKRGFDDEKSDAKQPINLFSKPIPLGQNDEDKKSRLKVVIIEALLFGGFLTAITAMSSLSGIADKVDPQHATNSPNLLYFLLEFVVFTIIVGVVNYFVTEKRVNDYNAKMAGVNVNIDDEIAGALAEQEADGLTPEDVAAQNKSNGEEEKKAFIDVKCTAGEDSLTEKSFEASIDDVPSGSLTTAKGVIVDANGFETVILKITKLEVSDGDFKNGVVMELINAVKAAASDSGLAAIAISKSVFTDFDSLNLSDGEKFKVTYAEPIKLQEAYPGALMGVSGEMK